jgi:peptidoglycan hydrolase-like protein with peptidoglycan-binding domain
MALKSPRFSRNERLQRASENSPLMKQGEQGEAVALVQDALIDVGLAMPLTTGHGQHLADGIYGPETANVVKQFQTAHGLVRDGIVGRQTLGKLEELIAALFASRAAERVGEMRLPPKFRSNSHRTVRRA